MKVFLSWSGDFSREIAKEFEYFLKVTIQSTEPWMSTGGIEIGQIWANEILFNLSEAKVGVLFLTSENKDKPWLLFEAGALIKQLGQNRVCPLLIDFDSSDLRQPLALFQTAKLTTKDSIYELLTSINNSLGHPLGLAVLEASFNAHWEKFRTNCDNIIKKWQHSPLPKTKTTEDIVVMVDEVLRTVRDLSRSQTRRAEKERNVYSMLERQAAEMPYIMPAIMHEALGALASIPPMDSEGDAEHTV